jgi:hypothetical protein
VDRKYGPETVKETPRPTETPGTLEDKPVEEKPRSRSTQSWLERLKAAAREAVKPDESTTGRHPSGVPETRQKGVAFQGEQQPSGETNTWRKNEGKVSSESGLTRPAHDCHR